MPDGAVNYLRHPIDGKLMTLVAAGRFRAGRGRNPIWLPAYYIDVRPTTNMEYLRFLGATDHRPPRHWPNGTYSVAHEPGALDDEPVMGVSFDDACAYAFWAAKELPLAAQWERGVRGAEGMVRGEVWEWVRSEDRSGKRGSEGGRNGASGGGFRCVGSGTGVAGLVVI